MSLSQINDYGIGDVNLTSLMETLDRQRRGYQAISLTHYDDNLEPKIAAGSIVELGGALFKCEADESITGWAGIGNDNDVYIKLVPSGTTATAAFTTAAPTWSTSKQGWYVGNDRYIGGLRKDAGGNYTKKWLYTDPQSPKIKIGSDTRSIIGDQIITGIGFRPSIVIFAAADAEPANKNWSIGFDDGITNYRVYQYDNGTAMSFNLVGSISIRRGTLNRITGSISALGPDGFTITWNLTGDCEAEFIYLCLP